MKKIYLLLVLLPLIAVGVYIRHWLALDSRVDLTSCLATVSQEMTLLNLHSVSPKWTVLDPEMVKLGSEIPEHCWQKGYVRWGRSLVHPQLLDPWGTPVRYEARLDEAGMQRRVISAGPDKKFDTSDDISSDYFNKK
jgi:hypothetical protein